MSSRSTSAGRQKSGAPAEGIAGCAPELRDLTRTRKQLVREIAQHTLRIQKVLEDANVKLTGVVSDVLRASGRAILTALVAGEADPERLVALTTGRLKAPRATLVDALHGRVTAHHRFLLQLHLTQIDALEAAVRDVEPRVGDALAPFRTAVAHLITMPGISHTVARVLLAEIRTDMSRFPTAGHLLSWAGLCPRLHESAGKRLSTRVRPGAPWLKTTLVQAAWAAVRVKDSYLQAQFLRLKTRRGPKKAILAVAASMLTATYHMLQRGVPYRELGATHFRPPRPGQAHPPPHPPPARSRPDCGGASCSLTIARAFPSRRRGRPSSSVVGMLALVSWVVARWQ